MKRFHLVAVACIWIWASTARADCNALSKSPQFIEFSSAFQKPRGEGRLLPGFSFHDPKLSRPVLMFDAMKDAHCVAVFKNKTVTLYELKEPFQLPYFIYFYPPGPKTKPLEMTKELQAVFDVEKVDIGFLIAALDPTDGEPMYSRFPKGFDRLFSLITFHEVFHQYGQTANQGKGWPKWAHPYGEFDFDGDYFKEMKEKCYLSEPGLLKRETDLLINAYEHLYIFRKKQFALDSLKDFVKVRNERFEKIRNFTFPKYGKPTETVSCVETSQLYEMLEGAADFAGFFSLFGFSYENRSRFLKFVSWRDDIKAYWYSLGSLQLSILYRLEPSRYAGLINEMVEKNNPQFGFFGAIKNLLNQTQPLDLEPLPEFRNSKEKL